jgi:dipeptidyl aminopeptidase/acylaminoacyl peptidase
MHPVEIKSRDGLTLVSYLTLPANVTFDPETLKPSQPLPMVLAVHGGPWARDSWGLNREHQWLANRGYAVLSVNFRGSTGFGKSFVSASFGEWGGKMHDDLIDSVDWAVDSGIAIKNKVAIKGASYGGYATLVGLTMTAEVFAAGVNVVGVANLVTFEETKPAYWLPLRNASIRRMGADYKTPDGRAFLLSRSPTEFAANITKPLLIGHGDNDPRVKLSEAELITSRMVDLDLPVTLVRFPDEGHGFRRPENAQSFNAAVEVFLQKHLGGRAEPLSLVPGTTINVPTGAEYVPGLPEALQKINQ